jgi:MFS family permease
MTSNLDRDDSACGPALARQPDCPLSHRQQTRNLLLYACNWALIYLASPVTYVSLVHAALLKRLGFNDVLSNLPAGVYLWTTPIPVLVVWYFPQVRQLKSLLMAAFLVVALMGLVAMAAVCWLGPAWVLAALIAHAAVLGCAIGVAATCQWEMVGRGVTEARRGQALALAFGAGPVLAVIASLGAQLVLAGQAEGINLPLPRVEVPYPWNFASLFAASAPIMALAALLSSRFLVPRPAVEVVRQPFVSGVLGGFGQFFGYRLLLLATLAYILVYSGHMVMNNISLFTREAIGEAPEKYAGLQLALRFGFKIVAGFSLGWLLIRTNPKTLLVTTAGLSAAGVAWALVAPGEWFLLSFGIMGAGELFGVYYPNYILACSPKSRMRRNMAFTSLITMPVGFAPLLFGFISDTVGASNRRLGFQASFVAALLLLGAAIVLVLCTLPARPGPRKSDMDASDLVPEDGA